MDRDDQQEAYAHTLMQWRYDEAVQALQRCVKAGANEEDIKTLCRETGVNVKDVLVGGANAAHG